LLYSSRFRRGYHSRSSFLTDHAYFRYGGGDSRGLHSHRRGCRLSSGWLADRLISPLRHDSFLLVIDDRDADTGVPAVSMSQIWPFVIIYGLVSVPGGTLLPS